MIYTMEQYEESARAVRVRLGGFAPEIALVLGSGLGSMGDQVEDPIFVDYRDIPHFKCSTAPGHRGRLVFGTLEGRQVAPILEELAKEYDGKIVIYKIDTDKEQGLAAAFGIRSIPTILFIPQQGKPQVAQGALPKEELKKAIDEFLLGGK